VRTSAAATAARPRWRERLHEVIFEADTPAGRFFDLALLVAIALSVAAVLLESVAAIRE
jgi:voltage-gated potassium channel